MKTLSKGGKELLRMDQYELVRTACRVYVQNISELSRMTGHSRNTIKKAIRGLTPSGFCSVGANSADAKSSTAD